MSGIRHGCYHCFETLDPKDKRVEFRSFLECKNCRAHYHKVCWNKNEICLRCGHKFPHPIEIPAPPLPKAILKTQALPSITSPKSWIIPKKFLIAAAIALVLTIYLCYSVTIGLYQIIEEPESTVASYTLSPRSTLTPSTETGMSATSPPTSTPRATSTRRSPTAAPPTATPKPSLPSLQIVYVRGGVGNTDIYVANKDGNNRTCIACSRYDEAEPAWSPDGRYIVYQSNAGGTYDIWRVNSSGGTASQLTRTSNLDEREPNYSPDGTHIAYRASPARSDRNADGDLRIMNADGSASYSLGVRGRSPVWSPDGQSLAYMSKRSGGWEVYIHSFQNNSSRRLTHCSANCRWPAWSPDGQYVIYHSTTSASSTIADTIWYMPVSGGSAKQLVTGYHPGRATWSRYELIAFNSDRGIEVIQATGNGRRVLIRDDQNWAPVWSE